MGLGASNLVRLVFSSQFFVLCVSDNSEKAEISFSAFKCSSRGIQIKQWLLLGSVLLYKFCSLRIAVVDRSMV